MRMRTSRGGILALAAIFGSIHCGGGETALSNTVNGSINGRAFAALDAIATQATGSGFSFGGPATYVQITDYANACVKETSHVQPTSGQRLVLGLASYDASGKAAPPTQPGTFPVNQNAPGAAGSNTAELYYDGGCLKADAHAGLSGSVVVTAIGTDGSIQGTFNITLTCDGFSNCSGPDATLNGSFHATACSGLSINSTPSCG